MSAESLFGVMGHPNARGSGLLQISTRLGIGRLATRDSEANRPFDVVTCADNLAFARTLPAGCCDLIYVDPPFPLVRGRASASVLAPRRPGPPPTSLTGYLRRLRPRLVEMRRLLSPSGSLYVHLNWRGVHYVKVLLDELFGFDNFLSEIVWSYRTGGRPGPWFARNHETLLLYAKSVGKHTFHRLRDGMYRTKDLRTEADGRPFKSTRRGRIYFHTDGPACGDVWEIPFLSTVSKERTRYRNQKPEALLERVIRASSNEGDLVADFFCGSGTTLVVAKRLNRRWLGCDISPEAVRITRCRLGRASAAV